MILHIIWTCTPQIKCRKHVTSKASTHIQTSLSTPQATNILPSLVVKSPLWNWAPVCSAASCDHKQWGSWRIDRERLYSCRQYFQPHKGSKLQDVGFSIPIQHQWHPFLRQDYSKTTCWQCHRKVFVQTKFMEASRLVQRYVTPSTEWLA